MGSTVPPEVFHSEDGTQLLKNFVVDICGGNRTGVLPLSLKRL